MGLRERKKTQTRQHIAQVAWRLFADHGFDQVTVAHIAREAEVAVATVFNYFPTKEALFFSSLETFEARLLEAVATRPAGEPVLVAFRRFLLASGGLLAQADAGDAQALERLRTLNRVIAASPTLQAHEHLTLAATADALAALLAAETNAQPKTPTPRWPPTPCSGSSGPWSPTPAGGSWPTRPRPAWPPTSSDTPRPPSRCWTTAWATTPPDDLRDAQARALAFRRSNSAWSIVPASSSSLARAICSVGTAGTVACDVPNVARELLLGPLLLGRGPLGHALPSSDEVDERGQEGQEHQEQHPQRLGRTRQ